MSTQLTGAVQVVAQGLYDSSSAQLHNYGELVHTNDGRAFRYCEAGGTALVSGSLYQGVAENTSDADLAVAAASIGDETVTTTSTVTVSANEYANGFLVVNTTPGLGKVYAIKSHPAASGAVVTITLADPIEVALTSSSRVTLVSNPYKDVVIAPTTETGPLAGVAVCPIAANEFGWLGVGGPQPMLAEGSITVGIPVVRSDTTAGAVETVSDGAHELLEEVGSAITTIATGDVGMVQMHLR